MNGVVVSIDDIIEKYKNADINFEELSLEKLRKYAERGNAKAQNILGDKYYTGEEIEADYKEAIKWYEKSADLVYHLIASL